MNRIKLISIGGNRYPMVYTIGAAKWIEDNFGDFREFLNTVQKETKGLNFKPLLFCIEMLIRQGCGYLNAFQHDYPLIDGIPLTKRGYYKAISAKEIADSIKTKEIPDMVLAVSAAYEKGVAENMKGVLTPEARRQQGNTETSGNLAWYDFHCRSFGMEYKEYHLLTPGEVHDLAICKAIQAGAMNEDFDTDYIPKWK